MYNKNINGIVKISKSYETLKTNGTSTPTKENEFGIKIDELIEVCKRIDVNPVLRIPSAKGHFDFTLAKFGTSSDGYVFVLLGASNGDTDGATLLVLSANTTTKTYTASFSDNEAGAFALDELTDVELTDLADGQMLAYNSTSEKWENVNPPTGVDELGELTDVELVGTPSFFQCLQVAANGKWANKPVGYVYDFSVEAPSFNLDSGGIAHLLYNMTKTALRAGCPVVFAKLPLENGDRPKTFQPIIGFTTNGIADDIDVFLNSEGKLYHATITHGTDDDDVFELQTVTPVIDSQLPQNGDVLVYNSTSQRYQNKSLAREQASVTADGVKTTAELIRELININTTKITSNSVLILQNGTLFLPVTYKYSNQINFNAATANSIGCHTRNVYYDGTSVDCLLWESTANGNTSTSFDSDVPTSGETFTLIY